MIKMESPIRLYTFILKYKTRVKCQLYFLNLHILLASTGPSVIMGSSLHDYFSIVT